MRAARTITRRLPHEPASEPDVDIATLFVALGCLAGVGALYVVYVMFWPTFPAGI